MSDVWVVAEHLEGKLSDLTLEMLGKGRELAEGGGLVAVLMGHGVADLTGELGAAHRVLVIEDAMLAGYTPETHGQALGELVKARAPRLVMIGNTAVGMDLATGLSGQLGLPLVAYCKDLRAENGSVVAVSQLYGGKILVESVLEGGEGIVTVLAGAFKADPGKAAGRPQVEEVPCPALGSPRIRFKKLLRPPTGDVDISKESVLVSVGRGIQSQDNLPLVEDLAKALGGALAASRPIVDNGWLPKTRQVGKSGMTVKPKLYVAVGISGAPEHLEGMRDAELIIAINPDAGAPIFEAAHYGIAADLFDIVPLLTERLQTEWPISNVH
jgi:electron transfer flavoprotein alpha subunit